MVVTGGTHTLALKADGTVWAWGRNDYGQLGLGTSFAGSESTVPRQVKFFKDATANPPIDLKVVTIAAGQFHSMALTEEGKVYVWGRNDRGQIGNTTQATSGTNSKFNTPQLVSGFRVWDGSISAYTYSNQRLKSSSVPQTATGWQYAFTWGENGKGQLGSNDLVDKYSPVCYDFEIYHESGFGNDFTGAAAGSNHTVFSARTWSSGATPLNYRQFAAGDNTFEQLHGLFFDNPQKTFYSGQEWAEYPIRVHAGNNYSFISAERWYNDAALASDPTLAGVPIYGSGNNALGQIGIGFFGGDNPPNSARGWPQRLHDDSFGLYGLKQLATGAAHNLARMADGRLYVWGANKSSDGLTNLYQLGLNGETDAAKNHNLPRFHPHPSVQDVAFVAAGGNSSFAVRREGTVYGWGANQWSQLGLGGASTTAKGVPTALSGGFRLWNDTDSDGLPDEWELYYFGSLDKGPSDQGAGETLTYKEKWERFLNPTIDDTDGDQLTDDYEVSNQVFMPDLADPTGGDYDHDGLSNLQEQSFGTSAHLSDTDGDGASDLIEVENGGDPLWGGDFGVPKPPSLQEQAIRFSGSGALPGNEIPTPLTTNVVISVAVGDTEGSRSERYKIVIRGGDGTVFAEVVAPDYDAGDPNYYELPGEGTIVLPAGAIYSFEIVHLATHPSYQEDPPNPDYDWMADIRILSGAGRVYDPENILKPVWHNGLDYGFEAAGKLAYVGGIYEPSSCEQPTFLSSTSEASGPTHRKIALNGLPMPDSKPQAKEETDQEHEQTYIDALTQQLRHSTTDVYVPLVGNELTLSVRRDIVPEVWSTRPGLPPETALTRPFGTGWATNLCSHIQFIYHVKNTPSSSCATERPQPDLAVVTDESGQSHRFLRIWEKDANGNALREAFLPYPSNRNESESFLTELTKGTVEGQYVFRKKFGTTILFAMCPLRQGHNTSAQIPSDAIAYTYARAVEANDRLGNKLVYIYDENDVSLVPQTITANGNRSLVIQKDPGATGLIRSVTDPRTFKTSYGYTTKIYNDPYRGSVQYSVLSSVTTPELTTKKYGYEENGPIWDYTPYAAGGTPLRQEYFFASHLNQITDA
ncbi:MAG: hypothetical protein EOP84_08925, partial [Verrucomicrobiaceae bacterium]